MCIACNPGAAEFPRMRRNVIGGMVGLGVGTLAVRETWLQGVRRYRCPDQVRVSCMSSKHGETMC